MNERRQESPGRRETDVDGQTVEERLDAQDAQNRRLLRLTIVAYCLMGLGVVVGFAAFQIQRSARIDATSTIVGLNCQTNNGQDRVLTKLVRVSLDGSGSFGENIDVGKLSPFDIQVLTTIAKVQALSAKAPPTEQQKVFRRQYRKLRDLQPCGEYVQHYKDGEPIVGLK